MSAGQLTIMLKLVFTRFKRDQEGNEILISDTNYVSVQDEMGDQVISHEQRKKIVDDQTPEVSVIFTKWKIQEGIAW